ncbi:MAG TPA: hypothetical protein VK464_12195 [Symbiobacteriaceae bacterium]|jgi:hypothetical protein|nr:hypothetical protein [Symbiobacteriaceae bacterium]
MTSLEMGSYFPFTSAIVDEIITRRAPGNYALGFVRNGRFVPRYIGRAESDVRGRIKDHLGESPDYKYFKFRYAASPRDAFLHECMNYHGFIGGLDNWVHPARPAGTDLTCPYCEQKAIDSEE